MVTFSKLIAENCDMMTNKSLEPKNSSNLDRMLQGEGGKEYINILRLSLMSVNIQSLLFFKVPLFYLKG